MYRNPDLNLLRLQEDLEKAINSNTSINEPAAALKSLAKQAGKSYKKAEEYYKEAKKQRMKAKKKNENELNGQDYSYIMGVVKKRLGLPTKPLKDSEDAKEAWKSYQETEPVRDTLQHTHKKEGVCEAEESIKPGDTVEIMDKEGNTTVVPSSKVEDVDTALGKDGEQHLVVKVEGSPDWYSEEEYQIVKVGGDENSNEESAEESALKARESLKDVELLDEADLIATVSDEDTARKLAQEKKGWYRKDDESGKFKVYVGERKIKEKQMGESKVEIGQDKNGMWYGIIRDEQGQTESVTIKNNEEEVKEWLKERGIEESRGQGQGVGGSRQKDGGANFCVCPECGFKAAKEKGVPCKSINCPNCGHQGMTGVNEGTLTKSMTTLGQKLEDTSYLFKKINQVRGALQLARKVGDKEKEKEMRNELDNLISKLKETVVSETSTTTIKIKHPGILNIPDNKYFWQMPLKHYINLAKEKGKKAIMTALLNLERWNKKKNPDISKKASNIIDKLKNNKDWQNESIKEDKVSEENKKKYQELAEKLFLVEYLSKKEKLSEKERTFIEETKKIELSDAERELIFEKYLDLKAL